MTSLEALSAVSNVATAVGVIVAARQLFITRRQAVTTFEDSLTAQYRALIERIPLNALLGEPMGEAEVAAVLPHFYRYFDLCNEQAFLVKRGRITGPTWENWKDGILSNMRRPSFARAWAEIAARATADFDHLRELCPPGKWGGHAG